MTTTILIFDLSDRERRAAMVDAFVGGNREVYFFHNGAYRTWDEPNIKQIKLPRFDLVIQHRNDPLGDIPFKNRVWYGGGKQLNALQDGEEVIFRQISGATNIPTQIEASLIIDFFKGIGDKPQILSAGSKRNELYHMAEFLKECSQYSLDAEGAEINIQYKMIQYKITQFKNNFDLNLEPAHHQKIINALDELGACPKESFRNQFRKVRDILSHYMIKA